MNEDTLETLWLERLPDTVHTVISIVGGTYTYNIFYQKYHIECDSRGKFNGTESFVY